MYVRDDSKAPVFNAVLAAEGKFSFRPSVDQVPTIEVKMVYLNSETQTTYGFCPYSTFSPRTIEAFMEFLRCAESDYGDVVFEGGVITPFGPMSSHAGAESGKGLPKGLGEE